MKPPVRIHDYTQGSMRANASLLPGGLIVPLVTPLSEDEKLDRAGLERLIEHVIAGGVNGIFVLGTTGEGASLSGRLRREVIRECSRLLASRAPLLVGISDPSYAESLALVEFAGECGAAACAFTPPYYFTYSQGQLVAYVERLAAASSLPLVLYNIPRFAKVKFSVETVRSAAELPGVIGIKDSSGDLDYLKEVIAAVRGVEAFRVFVGPEEILLDALKLGVCGGVCGGANLSPRLFVELVERARAGHWDEAERLQNKVRQNSAALYTVGDPETSYLRGLKVALQEAGLCSDLPALPLQRYSEVEKTELRRRYNSCCVASRSS